jgi:hypothetical protein
MREQEREQAYNEYKALRRTTISAATEAGPQELDPLQPNQRRMFFSQEGYLDALRNGVVAELIDTNENVAVEMTLGEQFCVTVTMKQGDAAGAGK